MRTHNGRMENIRDNPWEKIKLTHENTRWKSSDLRKKTQHSSFYGSNRLFTPYYISLKKTLMGQSGNLATD